MRVTYSGNPHSEKIAAPRRIAALGLASAGAMALVVLSAGSASALPPLDAVDDVAAPLNNAGTVLFAVLANDTGQDGLPADCSSAPTNNCQFDPASVDPAGQQGANGLLVINPETGDADYTTTIDPAVDPAGYEALLASAPACSGVIDTFEYTLIGSIGGVANPASTDTATVSIAIGTALTGVDAVDDAASTKRGVAVEGNVLANDCDQTNTTPASPENVTAALASPPTNGSAVVEADGTTTYTPEGGFVGTDTFSYSITTVDAGEPRSDTATVTVTVTAAGGGGSGPTPPAPPAPPKPELPATGADNVLPIGLAGGALLLVGSTLVMAGRRRRSEIG